MASAELILREKVIDERGNILELVIWKAPRPKSHMLSST